MSDHLRSRSLSTRDAVASRRCPVSVPDSFLIKSGHVCANWSPGMHEGDMHYEVELGIVLEGAWELRFDTVRTVVGPGEVWLTGTCEPHLFGMHRGPCELVTLAIMPHTLANASVPGAETVNWLAPFMAPPAARPKVSAAQRSAMLALGHRIVEVLEGPRHRDRQAQLMLLLLEALLLLQRGWEPGADIRLPPRTAYASSSEALRLVFESTGRLPAQRVANELGISRFRFHRLFKQTMGISFAKFALRLRLSYAAHELRAFDDSVKQITLRNGFVDTSHFVHAFKTYYGCTPSEYRAQHAASRERPPSPRGYSPNSK